MRESYCSCRLCLSVCPSVTALAASASVHTCNQRYSWVSLRLFWILTRGFFKNLPFKSYGVKKRICKYRELFSCTFGINEGQNLPEAQLVGQVLLERLATGAHRHKTSEIGHCLPATTHRGYEASYAHAQYTYCRASLNRIPPRVLYLVLFIVVVFSFIYNSKTVKCIRLKLCTMIEYPNPACNVIIVHVINRRLPQAWFAARFW